MDASAIRSFALNCRRDIGARLRETIGPEMYLVVLRILYIGTKRCHVCGSRVQKFRDQGYWVNVLFTDQVIGGMPRRADECPVCRANSRARLVYFYLTEFAQFPREVRVLHVAPERALQLHFRSNADALYVVADLAPSRYIKNDRFCRLDVTMLPFADETFDLVICNHVLEHVHRDGDAMREIRRTLRKDGLALMQVPFTRERQHTLESEPHDTDMDRLRKFGQADHVRLYAKHDYIRRLQDSGFQVEEFWAWRERPERAAFFDVDPLEPLFLCRRSRRQAMQS